MAGNANLWGSEAATDGDAPLIEPSHVTAVLVTGIVVQDAGDRVFISGFQSVPCERGFLRQVESKWVMMKADYEALKRVCAQTNGLHLALQ